MSIVKTINDAYTASVKTKDNNTRDTLKLVKAAFLTLEKAGKTPTESDYMSTLQKMVKARKENAAQYPQMAVTDLAEAAIIEQYIPQQMTTEQVSALITVVIKETGLTPIKKNMGAIVKEVVKASGGMTDGKTVSGLVSKIVT